MVRKVKPKQLDDETHNAITAHTGKGTEFFDQGRFQDALAEFSKALPLIPEPIEDWEATTWVLTAIGDCYFFLRDYERARAAFARAVKCPGGLGNWFVHLRLGQTQFELGDMSRARDELARAYMGEGKEAFEDDDPKYFEFIRRQMKNVQ